MPTVCDEQLVEVADKVNGELTCSPLDGLLMLTLASAGRVETKSIRRGKEKSLINLPRHVYKHVHVVVCVGLLALAQSQLRGTDYFARLNGQSRRRLDTSDTNSTTSRFCTPLEWGDEQHSLGPKSDSRVTERRSEKSCGLATGMVIRSTSRFET